MTTERVPASATLTDKQLQRRIAQIVCEAEMGEGTLLSQMRGYGNYKRYMKAADRILVLMRAVRARENAEPPQTEGTP